MANTFKLKRGTSAQIAAAAASNGLANGEPYLITDEQRIAIGLGPNTFERFAKLSEVGGGDKVSSNVTGITGADQITNVVSLTQDEYDAIGTKNAATLYVIAG